MTVALSKLNFRDLGGLPAAGGRRLRHRMVYRSEGPASFAEDHQRELTALGFRLICDLRADVERRKAPHTWENSARLLNLDITNDLRTETNQGWTALRDDPSEAGARKAMIVNYAAIPAAVHPHIGLLIDAIAAGETPVLIHCTAGKDRTGVLIAILLTALGVAEDRIIEDYKRSDVFAKNLRLGGSIAHAFNETFGFVPGEETINAMIGVFPEFLQAALDEITRGWGSIDAYLETAGVDADRLAAFRAVLLE
jgi:protein-tyrosine phosphatase